MDTHKSSNNETVVVQQRVQWKSVSAQAPSSVPISDFPQNFGSLHTLQMISTNVVKCFNNLVGTD